MSALSVRHDSHASRFEAWIEGLCCHADYRLEGEVMTVHHTEVPPALEGRGIAGQIVRAVFDHAATHGLRIRPACSYVRTWALRHPEVRSLLVNG